MTLTLADLDHWDPNSIHGVFKAAIDRANGVRSTATQIGDVMATTPWEGDRHDAAMQAAGRVNADLISHAEECEAVARAARAAEAEVRDIQRDWHNFQRMADRWGIAINTETGELPYLPPPDPNDPAEMEHASTSSKTRSRPCSCAPGVPTTTSPPSSAWPPVRKAVADLNQQLADRPPVPMNEQQGTTDATELWQNGTLSPDAQARLNPATTLSPPTSRRHSSAATWCSPTIN
ncbi:hypothetical protein [Mycobacterium sp.]|jgi:hypothetical protein|uniref:hypothetical protein n=1 Tax=Mycobacterium sp. TaxID=1785 RepID=UPI0028BBF449|nr:hypothetical protein [Mycobacterium sp.]MDT5056163.1 hypothetical protein [Mycobacterium sp.]